MSLYIFSYIAEVCSMMLVNGKAKITLSLLYRRAFFNPKAKEESVLPAPVGAGKT